MRMATLMEYDKNDFSCKSHPNGISGCSLILFSADSVVNPYIWSLIEPSAAVICACLTTYRPLFRTSKLTFLQCRLRSKGQIPADAEAVPDSRQRAYAVTPPWKNTPGEVRIIRHYHGSLNKKVSRSEVHVTDLGTGWMSPYGFQGDDEPIQLPARSARKSI